MTSIKPTNRSLKRHPVDLCPEMMSESPIYCKHMDEETYISSNVRGTLMSTNDDSYLEYLRQFNVCDKFSNFIHNRGRKSLQCVMANDIHGKLVIPVEWKLEDIDKLLINKDGHTAISQGGVTTIILKDLTVDYCTIIVNVYDEVSLQEQDIVDMPEKILQAVYNTIMMAEHFVGINSSLRYNRRYYDIYHLSKCNV